MRTFTHALLARIVSVLLFSLLVHLPVLEPGEPAHLPSHPRQSSGQPNFRVEIHSITEHGPQIVLTNLTEEPLTACFLQISFWKEDRKPIGELWDAFLQNTSPIAKDGDVSLPLGHVVGQPLPDKVEVAAAVWADGTTFGSPDELKRILSNRAYRAHSLDRIISLLQTGIQQDWTRDQYLTALDDKSRAISAEAYGLRSTLEANPNLDTKPRVRQKIIQTMLDSFSKERDLLRQSKPDFNTPINPV
jgi:hypothetical protein